MVKNLPAMRETGRVRIQTSVESAGVLTEIQIYES